MLRWERETRRAFEERRQDPNYVRRYRTVAQSHIVDDDVVAVVCWLQILVLGPVPVLTWSQSRVLPLADDASTVLDPRRPAEVSTAARNYNQMNEERGVSAADAKREAALSVLLL